MAKQVATPEPKLIELPALDIQHVVYTIRGLSPGLLVHKFSDKTRKQIQDKQQGKAQSAKAPRNPEEEANEARYLLTRQRNGATDGFPASGIARAMVSAGGRFGDAKMTELRGAFYITTEGDNLLPIFDREWELQTHPCRLARNVASFTHRPFYAEGWRMEVPFEYSATAITADQIGALLALAGFHIGIGDWRPEHNGTYGRFEIVGG